jgi:hypothetical protein
MGEYMRRISDGARIKVGTCEDLWSLRYDQLRDVAYCGDADPSRALDIYRFRFPWPDEDGTPPGDYADPFRELGISGVAPPEIGLEHSTCQFVSHHGYVVSLPCPESPEGDPRVVRNGNAGPVRLAGQAIRGGRLVAICRCGGCHVPYRVPTLEDAQPILTALRATAEWRAVNGDAHSARWYGTVAERLEAGYYVVATPAA